MFDFLRRKKLTEVIETEFGKQIPISEITGFVLKGKQGKKKPIVLNRYKERMGYGEIDLPEIDKYSSLTMFICRDGQPNVADWTVDFTKAEDVDVEIPEDIEKMTRGMMKEAERAKAYNSRLATMVEMVTPPQPNMEEFFDSFLKGMDKYNKLGERMGISKPEPFKNEFLKIFTDSRVQHAGMSWLGSLTELATKLNDVPNDTLEDELHIPDAGDNKDGEDSTEQGNGRQTPEGNNGLGQGSRREETSGSREAPDVYDKYVKDEYRENKNSEAPEPARGRGESDRVLPAHVPEGVQGDNDSEVRGIPRTDAEKIIENEEYMIPKEAKNEIKQNKNTSASEGED